ncbi:EAL domain-containing protein [Bacillus sp. FJAT-22090]|uniref:sensor domain-containing protein n=1 Tax=Bacillus sp. FJAT-22090 TaxID=1581038 RepID=UPI0011AB1410|nr:EAL domain-containing protein [Bacillus sp. FJAT-22090]
MENMDKSNLLYHSLFEHNPNIVYFINTSGNFTRINKVFSHTLGYLFHNDLVIERLLPTSNIPLYQEAFQKTLSGVPQNMNTKFIHKDGHMLDIHLTMIPANLEGSIQGVFGIAQDITSYVKVEKLNSYLVNYDSLTGLPNRRLFQENIEQAIIIANTLNKKVAVMYLDLDRFKYINDTLGHTLGDKLLVQIAEKLKAALPIDAVVARLGGDEFGILLPDFYMQQAAEHSKNVIQSLEEPFLVENFNLFVTTSIGISIFPQDGDDSLTLMKNADSALYKAKELGKNNFQVYSSSLNAQTYKIFSLESSLRSAIVLNQLELYYQPKVCTNTYDIIGAEALIRWNHPEWGLVSPDEFIPIAEEAGLDIEIGNWVKRTACTQNKLWQDANLPKIPVSINVSANRFLEKSLITSTIETLEETKLDSKYLEVEITETSLLENEKVVFSVLEKLKNLGIKVALDDFGTGYSSLSTLKRFKSLIDTLKIDRTFINDLTTSETEDSNFIANLIIQLSQQLNMEVVAEGVETTEQLHVLTNYNCNTIQGYLFSRPVPATEFEKLLRKGKLIPLESNLMEEESFDQSKDFMIQLKESLRSAMTLTQIRGKKVEIGMMEILIEEIGSRRLRFVSDIKLAASQDIILEVKTEILGEEIRLDGSIVGRKEMDPNNYHYQLEYRMEDSRLSYLTTTLEKLDAHLKKHS